MVMTITVILDKEAKLGMEATNRELWSRKIGSWFPDYTMEIPNQPSAAGYIREEHMFTLFCNSSLE